MREKTEKNIEKISEEQKKLDREKFYLQLEELAFRIALGIRRAMYDVSLEHNDKEADRKENQSDDISGR